MSEKIDGGLAFPFFDERCMNIPEFGMTIRDYFAASCMQGFMANKARPTAFQPEDDAAYFYAIADAMLAERAK